MLSFILTGTSGQDRVETFNNKWQWHKLKLQKWKEMDINSKAETLVFILGACKEIMGAPRSRE
jgi:hypothetical protein